MLKRSSLPESWIDSLRGIPLIVLQDGTVEKAIALQNLFKEIYIRDTTIRNRMKNIGELEDLPDILFSSIGTLINLQQ